MHRLYGAHTQFVRFFDIVCCDDSDALLSEEIGCSKLTNKTTSSPSTGKARLMMNMN